MIKYKYVHIMPFAESSFSLNFIQFIEEMNLHEHLFVLIAKEKPQHPLEKANVIYKKQLTIGLLRHYQAQGCAIVLHSWPFSTLTSLFFDKALLRDTSWWVWGHDLYRKQSVKQVRSSFLKKIVYWLKLLINVFYSPLIDFLWSWVLSNKLSHLRSIMVNCRSDYDYLRRKTEGSVKIFQSAYSMGYYNEDLDRLIGEKKKGGSKVIMIGHSAFPFLKHHINLDKLLPYKDEDIKILLPLSYGDKDYAADIAAYARDLFGSKAIVLLEYMDFISYIKLLSQVDIAIFDYEHQSALGNLFLLFFMGKKIYMSSTGVLYEGFLKEGLSIYDCKDIGVISYGDFVAQTKSVDRNIEFAHTIFSRQAIEKSYLDIFAYLK